MNDPRIQKEEMAAAYGVNMARDRIAQTYLGLCNSPIMQERSRRRINWMASEAKGNNILDIGCSEGILEIILAREGLNVTGIDVNKEAIDYAKKLIADENDFVRRRIVLIHSDVLAAKLKLEFYDTLVMGEILEHLTKPELILKKSLTYLKPGGKIIITTPFGYHPAPDHCQTFTLTSLSKLLMPHCNPIQFYVEDNYIRFVGIKEDPTPKKWSTFDNTKKLQITERATVAQQHYLQEQIKSFRTQSEKNQKVLQSTKKQLWELQEKMNILQVEREETEHQLIVLQGENKLAEKKIFDLEKQNQKVLQSTKKQLWELQEKMNILQVEREETEHQLIVLQGENKLAGKKIFDLEKQNKTISDQLKSRIDARKRAAENYYRTKERLENIANSLSFQLGHALTRAVSSPGINTILLPYRIIRIFLLGITNKFKTKKNRKKNVLNDDGPFFRPENKKYMETPYTPKDNRTFYILHSSLPWINNGYGTRSHGLLSAMKSLGIDVYGVTRLGFPVDFTKLQLKTAPEKDQVDQITYLRLPSSKYPYLKTPLDIYIQKYMEAILEKAKECNPAIIHACSNYANGIAATQAGRILKIPSIYECRGLWEVTRLSREPEWEHTEEYEKTVRLETEACNNATAVIAITRALKDYLVNKRGIPAEKITVVPNGVNGSRFAPRPRNKELEAKYNLFNKTVIGFVGSLVGYEGLDLLIEATAILKEKRDDFRVLLVGDGACSDGLKKQTDEANLSDIIHFTGCVSHDEVEEYYSLIDIAPFPRKSFLVCELISPLKPFEAMAMEKAIVASSVDALVEIVKDRKTGLIHLKDDSYSLADCLNRLLDDKDLRARMAKASREWVLKNRDWKDSAAIIKDLYSEVYDK